MKANLVRNALMSRAALIAGVIEEGKKNIDQECEYPLQISPAMYRESYRRNPTARRVVRLLPKECWKMKPEVYETEEMEETAWEMRWKELVNKHRIWHYFHKLDRLSGIGEFGIMLIGLDDGLELSEPAVGLDEKGQPTGTGGQFREIIYLRCFDQSLVDIDEYEKDTQNPRYGQPTLYNIKFSDVKSNSTATTSAKVHWSRVIHFADDCESSEVLATPRQEPVYNQLLDLKKISGSSAEMFYSGGFPGLSLETLPELLTGDIDLEIDEEKMKNQMDEYRLKLKRYLQLTGQTAKTLAPQVADPSKHIDIQLLLISIALDIPQRVFMGSEAAQLASEQDKGTWNDRLLERMNEVLTPNMIRATVDRFMALGIMDTIEEYFVDWPDLNTPSDEQKAETSLKKTQALTQYVSSGAAVAFPPREFYTMIMGLTLEEAEAVIEAAEEQAVNADDEEDTVATRMIGGPPPEEEEELEEGEEEEVPV